MATKYAGFSTDSLHTIATPLGKTVRDLLVLKKEIRSFATVEYMNVCIRDIEKELVEINQELQSR